MRECASVSNAAYLPDRPYLRFISDKTRKMKMCVWFYQSRPAALTTNPHPMLKIIKQNLFPQIQRPRLIPCIWEEKSAASLINAQVGSVVSILCSVAWTLSGWCHRCISAEGHCSRVQTTGYKAVRDTGKLERLPVGGYTDVPVNHLSWWWDPREGFLSQLHHFSGTVRFEYCWLIYLPLCLHRRLFTVSKHTYTHHLKTLIVHL